MKSVLLYGGAVSCNVPDSFDDASKLRDIPDHQEVFVDMLDGSQSLIIEIVDSEEKVKDSEAALFFFSDYAEASDASSYEVRESEIMNLDSGTTAVHLCGTFTAKHLGQSEANLIAVTMAILRLHQFQSEIILILNGAKPNLALMKSIATSFRILDSSLFK